MMRSFCADYTRACVFEVVDAIRNFYPSFCPYDGSPYSNHSTEEEIIAGEVQVLPGRENPGEVTLKQLIEDYKSCIGQDTGYCFLKVLSVCDRRNFLRAMALDQELLNYCYSRRAIKTWVWLRILRSIELDLEYYVYRRAYWGESSGREIASPTKTNLCVLLTVISGKKSTEATVEGTEQEEDSNSDDETKSLIKRISRLSLKPQKHLLIEDNHVKTMEIRRIQYPSWINDHYVLDNSEDEIGIVMFTRDP